jgi:hypothetical protein
MAEMDGHIAAAHRELLGFAPDVVAAVHALHTRTN